MDANEKEEFARALVEGQIVYARAHGLHIFLPPVLARACREAGLWDDAVHVETKPIPTTPQ